MLVIDLHPSALRCDAKRPRREAVGAGKAELGALHAPLTLRNLSARERCESPRWPESRARLTHGIDLGDDRIRVRGGSSAHGWFGEASILGAWVAIGVLAAPASAAQGWTAYVSGGGEVTPFATATNTPGMPIGVPIALGVALAPNGRTLYATSNTGSSGSVIPIDTATGTAGAAISIASPVAIAITPDGTTAYRC